MYTLYYSPGACSLIVHVLLEELGVAFNLEKADGKSPEYRAKVNPKGKVPSLATPQAPLLTLLANCGGAGTLAATGHAPLRPRASPAHGRANSPRRRTCTC